MENKYYPVNCSFHDTLLDKSTLKEICTFEIIQNEVSFTLKDVIIDVYTKNREEFLVLKSGKEFRLDTITALNGEKVPPSNCFVER